MTINPAYQKGELTHVLGQSRCSGTIVQDTYRGRDLVPVVEETRSELPALRDVIALSGWGDFLASGDSPRELPLVEPGDTAQIQYTSGTTGTPKGAELGSARPRRRRTSPHTLLDDPNPNWIATVGRPLPHHKTPRVWRFLETFPRTTSGKIQKFVPGGNHLAELDAGAAGSGE